MAVGTKTFNKNQYQKLRSDVFIKMDEYFKNIQIKDLKITEKVYEKHGVF